MVDMSSILAYVSAAVVALWGIAHVIPTGRVLAGFTPVTSYNRLVIKQEWLAEAFTMWGIAAIVIAVTASGGPSAAGTRDCAYRAADRTRRADRAYRGQDAGDLVQDLPVPARGIGCPAACC